MADQPRYSRPASPDLQATGSQAERNTHLTEIDSTVPNSARITNYWLGGKDNYAIDREAGERYLATFPLIKDMSLAGRLFLGRAVRYLVEQAGVQQFLDIGTGLPTADNTHEIAQRSDPRCRIVYVDNDPMVLAHARSLLTSTPEGMTAYLDADLLSPQDVLDGARQTLDFDEPVVLTMMGVLGHIPDDDQARSIIDHWLSAMCPGSYLLLGDGTNIESRQREAQQDYNDSGAEPYRLRSPEQLESLLGDLEVVEPGLVPCPQWRPHTPPADPPFETISRCALARKV